MSGLLYRLLRLPIVIIMTFFAQRAARSRHPNPRGKRRTPQIAARASRRHFLSR